MTKEQTIKAVQKLADSIWADAKETQIAAEKSEDGMILEIKEEVDFKKKLAGKLHGVIIKLEKEAE